MPALRLPADRAPEPLTDGELSELVDEAGRGGDGAIADEELRRVVKARARGGGERLPLWGLT